MPSSPQLNPGRYARAEVADAPVAVPGRCCRRSIRPHRTSWACSSARQGSLPTRKQRTNARSSLDPNFADAERNLAILLDLYLDDPQAALPHYERYQLLTQGADTQVTAWVAELKARIATMTRTAEATP